MNFSFDSIWFSKSYYKFILFVIVNQNYVLMFRQLMKCKLNFRTIQHYNIISSELHKPKF